jgi:hypothetical protein
MTMQQSTSAIAMSVRTRLAARAILSQTGVRELSVSRSMIPALQCPDRGPHF